MTKIFGAYLEDYHYIKLIVPTYEYIDTNNLWLVGNRKRIKMRVFKSEQFGNEFHIHTSFKGIIKLHLDYHIDIDNRLTYNLSLGKITRSPRFELENFYEGPLGFEYHKNYTIFRVWTPVAKDLRLVLIDNNNQEETFFFEYQEKGLWMIRIDKDIDGFGYYFQVRINERLHRCLDPYAISANANGTINYVVDMNKTYQQKHSFKRFEQNFAYVDSVICELSIRDFSKNLNVENPKTYLGMVQTKDLDDSVGLNYLKKVGFTHLQLMPFYLFGGVDEENIDEAYNWGYNPVCYNVPSGYYSTNPNDPYARINELKILIDTLHELGFGVNMDVVYNHVYDSLKFAYSTLVPGYVYRFNKENYMTNSSGCGNDVATDRLMMRRYIIESVLFWQNNYCIDGFRFDLMGLMDTDTINQITTFTKAINPFTMIYGEGWNMHVELPSEKRANMENFWALKDVGFFNDTFRNAIKASHNGYNAGYGCGGNINNELMEDIICGSCVNEMLFDNPNRSINYVECHDNYTFYDQLVKIKPNLTDDEYARYVLLSLGIVVFSQGIPFFHIGEEGLRTKQGIDNSYNLGDEINKLDWERIKKFAYVSKALTDMLTLRNKYQVFRLRDGEKIRQLYRFDKHCAINQNLYQKEISFKIKDNDSILNVIFKNDFEEAVFYFAPGAYLIFDGLKISNEEISSLVLNKPGVYIVKKN